MVKAGRKRKPGKRTESGRASRAGYVPLFDRGTDRTQAMQALYGQDGSDALGRAYKSGLLGEGDEAKAMLDTGRRIANAYWQAYSTGGYSCPLGERTFGNTADIDHERVKRRELWLAGVLASIKIADRRVFDQLVIDVNPDNGPPWLDQMIWVNRQNVGRKEHEKLTQDARNAAVLSRALDALAHFVD